MGKEWEKRNEEINTENFSPDFLQLQFLQMSCPVPSGSPGRGLCELSLQSDDISLKIHRIFLISAICSSLNTLLTLPLQILGSN